MISSLYMRKFQESIPGFHRAFRSGKHTAVVRGVCDNNRDDSVVYFFFDRLQIKLQQELSGFDLISGFCLRSEIFALEIDCVKPYMDQ